MAPSVAPSLFLLIADPVGARLARDGVRFGAAFFGRGTYPFLRSRLLMVPPLRRVTFFQTPKKVTKKRLPLRTAFAALRFPRSGVHQGASTPVGFASTSIRCPRLRRGALRAIPLMNTSTRPPDGAGRSRSKAKAKAKAGRDLPVGAFVAAAEPARLRSTAKRAQDFETAGGPSVLSQPAAAATGTVCIRPCG
ncbi:Transmembrane protein [Pseudomonas chlororaphis]